MSKKVYIYIIKFLIIALVIINSYFRIHLKQNMHAFYVCAFTKYHIKQNIMEYIIFHILSEELTTLFNILLLIFIIIYCICLCIFRTFFIISLVQKVGSEKKNGKLFSLIIINFFVEKI